jgi:hypothetical protein
MFFCSRWAICVVSAQAASEHLNVTSDHDINKTFNDLHQQCDCHYSNLLLLLLLLLLPLAYGGNLQLLVFLRAHQLLSEHNHQCVIAVGQSSCPIVYTPSSTTNSSTSRESLLLDRLALLLQQQQQQEQAQQQLQQQQLQGTARCFGPGAQTATAPVAPPLPSCNLVSCTLWVLCCLPHAPLP